MKHTNEHDFLSQIEPTFPREKKAASFFGKLQSYLKAPFQRRFDPSRLTEAERREAGIMECEVDWYQASNGPLIKKPMS